jgi:hypothetical protein
VVPLFLSQKPFYTEKFACAFHQSHAEDHHMDFRVRSFMRKHLICAGVLLALHACEEKAERPGGSPSKPEPTVAAGSTRTPTSNDPSGTKPSDSPRRGDSSSESPNELPSTGDKTNPNPPINSGSGQTTSPTASGTIVPASTSSGSATSGTNPTTIPASTADSQPLPTTCSQLLVEHGGNGGVILRTTPNASADPAAVLVSGQPLRNLGAQGDGYFKVRAQDGKEGFVWGTLLKCVETGKMMVSSDKETQGAANPDGSKTTATGGGTAGGGVAAPGKTGSSALPEEKCDEVKP